MATGCSCWRCWGSSAWWATNKCRQVRAGRLFWAAVRACRGQLARSVHHHPLISHTMTSWCAGGTGQCCPWTAARAPSKQSGQVWLQQAAPCCARCRQHSCCSACGVNVALVFYMRHSVSVQALHARQQPCMLRICLLHGHVLNINCAVAVHCL